MEIIESIMLYGFCLSMLGVDLPSVCLSVCIMQTQYHGEVGLSTVSRCGSRRGFSTVGTW